MNIFVKAIINAIKAINNVRRHVVEYVRTELQLSIAQVVNTFTESQKEVS